MRNNKVVYNRIRIFAFLLMLSVVIGVSGTVAWFASSNESKMDDIKMQSTSRLLRIEFRGNDKGHWYEKYLDRSIHSDAEVWLVSENSNFNNKTLEQGQGQGLEPGSAGVLEYSVVPSENFDSVTVDLVYFIRGIGEEGNENVDEPVLFEIADESLLQYLNAHIMLFESYDENTGKYKGLIENAIDGNGHITLDRVVKNKTYLRGNAEYTKVYWVWPPYLKNIISTDQEELLYVAEEREQVIEYIVKNKAGFFKEIDTLSEEFAEDDKLTEKLTAYDHYGMYSIKFDEADLEIGKQVRYAVLGMTIDEEE